MLTKKLFIFFFAVCISLNTSSIIYAQNDDEKIEIIVLQINDVYEIAPLPGDDLGGLARVSTLKKQLLEKNKNTIMVLAGDFLSPSVIGTLDDDDGNSIKGAHMVETLNHCGLDIAIFGNHEFDIKEKDLQKRLNETEFDWVSSNVFHVENEKVGAFYRIKENEKQFFPRIIIRNFTDEDGTQFKLGIFTVTLDVKKAAHVNYAEVFETADLMTSQLENMGVDMILPITHLNIADDELLAEKIPKFPLIIGGHDHNNMAQKVGNTIITKADANAKTAYVHTISLNKKTNAISVISELIKIDKSIPSDSSVVAIVDKWKGIAYSDLMKKGFNPDKLVTVINVPLDGREVTIRGGQCELGRVVTSSVFDAARHNPDIALTNSGSIRVDDILDGKLTQYDIIRILPYSGNIWEVEMTGSLLKQLLEYGAESKNEGAYIQWKNVVHDEPSKTFRINGSLIDVGRNYVVALNDFMLSGYDYNFFTEQSDGIIKIHKPIETEPDDVRLDIRKAVIKYLQRN